MMLTARSEPLTKPRKGSRKPERKRQAQEPLPQGDLGPQPPAMAHRAEVLPLYERGGGWRRRYVRHPLEMMAKPQGRARKGLIDRRQMDAGLALFRIAQDLERTSSPPWYRPYVDSSIKGDVNWKRIDAETAYKLAMAFVPDECRTVVEAVVCGEHMIADLTKRMDLDPTKEEELRAYWLELLRIGLDGLADAFGY